MDAVWIEKNGRRAPLAHELVLAVDAGLDARGLARSDRNAVMTVTADLEKNSPFKGLRGELLRSKYYQALPRPIPLSVEEDRCTSFLQKWGVPAGEARGLVTRAIAVADNAQKHAYVGQLFNWIDSRRAYQRQRKANYARWAVDEMEANRWPLMRGGSERTGKVILAALLNKGSAGATVAEVAAATKLNPITVQNYLANMHDSREIKRIGHGRYASLAEGLASYVQPSKVVLNDVLVNGKSTPAQIRARTGLSKAQVTASLHWLWRRAKKLEHTDYGEYAPPGSATPHVFTKDAIPKALQSGSKTVRELEELTGKNRGELWAALRGLRDRDEVVEAYLIYPGHRGCRAAFALPPAARRA